jgi:sugar phosphate isomerase/epimerase
MKYGIFSVCAPDWTPEELVPLLKQLGYDGIEWRVFNKVRMGPAWDRLADFWSKSRSTIEEETFPENARYIRDLCDKHGIEIAALGTYIECDDIPIADKIMRACADIGVKNLRISPKAYNGKIPFQQLFDISVAGYEKLYKLAQDYGCRILLEMHGGSLSSSASGALRLIERFGPKHFGVIYDTGCVLAEGYEKFAVDMLGEYLAHTHVKNSGPVELVRGEDGKEQYVSSACSIWKGRYDLEGFMRELKKINYGGYVSFEDFSTEESNYDKLVNNIAYMKGIEAKL